MCVGTCKFRILENKESCTGKSLEWMDLEEIARLHYLSNLNQNMVKEVDVL